MKYLIVYGTKQGQSGKIASFIGEELQKTGNSVDLWNAEHVSDSLHLASYDAFIIGGGVHISGYPIALRRWVRSHVKDLAKKPSAFFSVCLGILQNDPKVQEDERRIAQKFFSKTDWHPQTFEIFAGALSYSQYNWILKRIMRSIARRAGVNTDMNCDYEYTDWESVKRFSQKVISISS